METKPIIITIGREFGSGGHVIAEELAKRFDFPLFDSNLLETIAKENDLEHTKVEKYDERRKLPFISRTVKGYSNSIHDNVAYMQFDFLKRLADEGSSFVVVGRCAEYVLKDKPGVVSIFINGDKEHKMARVKRVYNLATDKEAIKMMQRRDWERKSYHNYYCEGKWGDSRNYDLSINSSVLGIKETTDLLEHYIKMVHDAHPEAD